MKNTGVVQVVGQVQVALSQAEARPLVRNLKQTHQLPTQFHRTQFEVIQESGPFKFDSNLHHSFFAFLAGHLAPNRHAMITRLTYTF